MSPLHGHAAALLEAVVVEELLFRGPELVDELGAFHVETAVFGDLQHPTLAPPADGVEPTGFQPEEWTRLFA